MDKVIAWNVRGLNSPTKQKEVLATMLKNKAGLVGLLETKIKPNNFAKAYSNVFQGWCVSSNINSHKGGRILILWLDTHFNVDVRFVSDQCIHVFVTSIAHKTAFNCTFIYASNGAADRKQLWDDLRIIKAQVQGAWILTGDFNCPLYQDDRIGSDIQFAEIADFQACVNDCDVTDLAAIGCKFTWSNNQLGDSRVMTKIDRCLINDAWLDLFPHSFVNFQPATSSDHSPALISFDNDQGSTKKSFIFFDMWCQHDSFNEVVKETWDKQITGTPMYTIVQKLKALKPKLKYLNQHHYNQIEERYQNALQLLQNIKVEVQRQPRESQLIQKEYEAAAQFKRVKEAYNSFLYQKAKVRWLKEGDSNTSFFHRSIKKRRFQQRVLEIKDKNGNVQSNPEAINKAFEDFYVDLLGTPNGSRTQIQSTIIQMGATITDQQANLLTMDFTNKEIKEAFFSIPGSKAPGPDGYNSTFFKEAWPIIGDEVCNAVRDFFQNGQLLKQVNSTKLTLIPKVQYPQSVSEFRPIACCNTLYKGITKLISARLKHILPHIISPNQAGFIQGRQIFHNISIVQDLVGVYNRKSTPPCCMIKVDIRKAYDSVDWGFLQEMLVAMNFPQKFIGWIMACVSSTSFSLCINGSTYGFFQGKRGLRQGDPMSPLLFVICMEYLSRLLNYAGKQKGYNFHYRCKSLALNHLVFADDLIIFCKGDYESIMWNLRSLATFAASSGLNANAGKSAIYTCNMDEGVKQKVLQTTKYNEEALPFSYLGVKISAKKLGKDDCQFLIDKIASRLRTWGVRSLSYAGRAQLVNSVLLNLHSYWASILVLPKKVIEGVITACRNYLWDGKMSSSKTPLIAWDLICRDKKMGGLGYKESHTWNLALLGKYIWSIATKADNLWVKWVDHVYLKGKDWKQYVPNTSVSWYWRQLTHIKDSFRSGYSGDRWVFGKKGYTATSGYNWLRTQQYEVEWSKWVWNRLNSPKHSFLSWIIMWKRLNTRDRLRRIGLEVPRECPLCGLHAETSEHLFIHCNYANICRQKLSQNLQVTPQYTSLQELSQWLHKPVQGKFRSQVVQSVFVALFYHIWMQRNSAIWKGSIVSHDTVTKRIKTDVFWRITSIMPKKVSQKDKDWLNVIMS